MPIDEKIGRIARTGLVPADHVASQFRRGRHIVARPQLVLQCSGGLDICLLSTPMAERACPEFGRVAQFLQGDAQLVNGSVIESCDALSTLQHCLVQPFDLTGRIITGRLVRPLVAIVCPPGRPQQAKPQIERKKTGKWRII